MLTEQTQAGWSEFDVVSVAGRERHAETRKLVVEEPLLIKVGGRPLTSLMRTPGEEIPLAAGFLITEGLVKRMKDIGAIRHCPENGDGASNVVEITLSQGGSLRPDLPALINSSCGICGRQIIDTICDTVLESELCPFTFAVFSEIGERMQEHQHLFRLTGGSHAAGIFDRQGRLLFLSEDVGRHNALDKAVGKAVLSQTPLADKLVLLTGRASYEMVCKAARAGVGSVASVSSPSSLAVEVARRLHMTLVGFLRDGRFNIYSGDATE